MFKNWKITAYLGSPLAGKPPYLDALLVFKKAHYLKIPRPNRTTPLADIPEVSIPVQRTGDLWHCSDPIYMADYDRHAHFTKRFETQVAVDYAASNKLRKINTGAGEFKAYHLPIRERGITQVVWFVRGDRREINHLLSRITSIGKKISQGYGIVTRWEYDEMDNDHSISAEGVLMKTVPAIAPYLSLNGYKRNYGAYKPPYWHRDNYTEILEPC